MVSVDLSLEQLANALRRLPVREKIEIWRLLDQDIDRAAISSRFSEALEAIRSAHLDVSEDEVMSEILGAQQEVRASRRDG
jgi:chromatin segregation and condensation protein Rec8/ScpA/Scc1 (kleisin family)